MIIGLWRSSWRDHCLQSGTIGIIRKLRRIWLKLWVLSGWFLWCLFCIRGIISGVLLRLNLYPNNTNKILIYSGITGHRCWKLRIKLLIILKFNRHFNIKWIYTGYWRDWMSTRTEYEDYRNDQVYIMMRISSRSMRKLKIIQNPIITLILIVILTVRASSIK